MSAPAPSSLAIVDAEPLPRQDEVLTDAALAFVAELHRLFTPRRDELLARRAERRAEIARTSTLDFLPETAAIRADDSWKVAPSPAALNDRRVEITGPTDRKMTINALNSGAKVWLADFEDASAPTWENVVLGQVNLADAYTRNIDFTDERTGKSYALKAADELATVVMRPRGWHLNERHLADADGNPVPGALVDFGLYFFHNAQRLIDLGKGPYFYLPKTESYLEARLWNDVFVFAQDYVGIPQGTVRATVLIETITAAYEMEEILYELRDHASGLNAGRWDYLFSIVKNFRDGGQKFVLPDRNAVTMTAPFMRAYTELLVRTCHKRGAHAIGGMAAFIPSRRDEEVNKVAFEKVKADKDREAGDGFDGSWVAHPDLVPIAMASFDAVLGDKPNQKDRLREDVSVAAGDLIAVDSSTPGRRTTAWSTPSRSASATSRPGSAGWVRSPSSTSWRTRPPPRSPARRSGSGSTRVSSSSTTARPWPRLRSWPARSPPRNSRTSAPRSARRPSPRATGSRRTTCCSRSPSTRTTRTS